MSGLDLKFRKATPEDEEAVTKLVNSVYRARGPRQWTTEVDLVVGPRINNKVYNDCTDGKTNVILLAFAEDNLVGCVHLENLGNKSNLGMLSVSGEHQQYGIGAKLLKEAEKFIQDTFRTPEILIQVISVRTELINWYLRKGYVETGETIPFGNHAESQNHPKDGELFFKVFRKSLS
jgi:GNAT superfamily N-acetyltransferase